MIDPDFENSNKDSFYQNHGYIKETEDEGLEVLPESNDSKDVEVNEEDWCAHLVEYMNTKNESLFLQIVSICH